MAKADKANPEKTEYYSIKRLRWNTLIFTGGKGVNAVLSLLIFSLIAANLSKPDFAIYAWLLAFIELSTNISRFGINWAVDRYVPELRSSLNSKALRRFIVIMTGLRALIIIALALGFYALGHQILSLGGKEDWLPAFDLYIIILIPFAITVFFRDVVFQSLLQQAHSQATTSLRHLIFLAILFYFLSQPEGLTLFQVIYCDIAATCAAAVVALCQTVFLLGQLPYGTPPTSPVTLTWRAVVKFAANSYANEVLRMSGSGYAVMSAAPQLLATAALAPYGFCQTLFTQLNRFLPAHLFSGLYRPRLVSQYTKTGDFAALNRQVNLILKVSNYILAMCIAVFFVYGDTILGLVSSGKYTDAHGLMMLFWVLMLLDNQRQAFLALANTIERVDFLRRASLLMPLVIPLAIALVFAGLGTYGLALALILPEIAGLGLIIYQIRRAGYDFTFDIQGQARIVAVMLIAILIGLALRHYLPDGLLWAVAGAALIGLAFVLCARLLRPMSEADRASIERLVGRKVYLL
ncbi:MAG: oligosaccharide flippase family protein [Geminicoccaceae bacterium]